MPTDTFYRLPAEKRERLRAAICGELSKAAFSRLSINQIVKAAGISRGSYYQYFRDMDDLYGYVVNDYKSQIVGGLTRLAEEENGDIFRVIPRFFDEAVAYFGASDNLNLIKHLFFELHERENSIFPPRCAPTSHAWFDTVLPHLDRAGLDVRTDAEFHSALMMLLGTTIGAVMEVLNGTPPAEARAALIRNLSWLEYGMRRTRV